jgi:hypothetical protein
VAVSFARSSTGASGGVGFQAPIPSHIMPEALLSQHTVKRVIGQSRLQRLLRAGWLKPVERNAHSVLFSPRDIHLALSRAERQRCPANQIEVARVRASEQRTGRAYVKKGRPQSPGLEAIELDFSALNLSSVAAPLPPYDDEGDGDDDQDLAFSLRG